MESHSETLIAANGARVEFGTVVFEGKPFTNMGSVVDKANGYVVGYPDNSKLKTWDGRVIGTCRVVSLYRIRSWIGSWMHCYRAVIDGENYYGRGFGNGMLLRLRRKRTAV